MRRTSSENVRLLFNGIWDGKIRGRYASNFRRVIKDSCQADAGGRRIPAAHDAFRLLMEVAVSNPRARGRELGMLLRTHEFSGLLGKRSFDKKGELLLPMPVFEVKNNEFRLFDVVH